MKRSSNDVVHDDVSKADLLADTFQKVHSDSLNSKSTHKVAADQIAHEILNSNSEYNYPNLSLQTIHNIINSLRNNKSPGKDKITALHLKKFSKKLLVQLLHIIQASLRLNYFPNAWKIAVVIPIPKHDKNKTYPSSKPPCESIQYMRQNTGENNTCRV